MQHLTRDELKGLVRHISNQRQKLMILVGFWHGLRVSELTGLVKEDVQDGYVKVQRLKGSLKTIQAIIKSDDPELDESNGLVLLANSLKTNERLFPMTRFGVYKLIQRAGKQAGIAQHKLHPHVLKHSIAMQTIHKAGIENVRQWLGHKNISSTGSYLKVSDEAAGQAIGSAMA